MKDRHLITVDELRAAGALDVPAAWRKSLGVERDSRERDLFSGLSDDDDSPPADKPLAAHDELDDDESRGCIRS